MKHSETLIANDPHASLEDPEASELDADKSTLSQFQTITSRREEPKRSKSVEKMISYKPSFSGLVTYDKQS